MRSETVGSVTKAGWALLGLAALHLVSCCLMAAHHVPGWATGELWLPPGSPGDPVPTVGAFWVSWGSFAVPLGMFGALVVWLGRRGQRPPKLLGYVIIAWALVAAALFEPSPFILGTVPGIMLARDWSARRAGTTQPAPTPLSTSS